MCVISGKDFSFEPWVESYPSPPAPRIPQIPPIVCQNGTRLILNRRLENDCWHFHMKCTYWMVLLQTTNSWTTLVGSLDIHASLTFSFAASLPTGGLTLRCLFIYTCSVRGDRKMPQRAYRNKTKNNERDNLRKEWAKLKHPIMPNPFLLSLWKQFPMP